MFDLISILFRYLFIFYIIYFLFQGINYILIERGHREGNILRPVKIQRYAISLTHIMGFAIIIINPYYTIDQRIEAGIYALAVLVFFILMFVITNKVYKNSCPLLFNGVFFLMSIGYIILYRLDPNLAVRQFVFSILGFALLICMPLVFKIIPKFEKLKWLYFIVGIGLLISLFFFGSSIYGSKSWLKIGPVMFQPSEFVKLLFVLFLASAMRDKNSMPKILLMCGLAAAFVLIFVMHKDLGSALIFFFTFMIILYVSTGSELLFFVGIAAAVVASALAFNLFPHVQERVFVWQNPWKDIHNTGYQITQSLFAITTGGAFGSGLFRGSPATIPVVERDFIFSAVTEEFGWIFALALIGVYIMIFYRGVHIALRCSKPFYSLLSVGLTGTLAFQTFIIIGGVINMTPMTGITLPFVSYGGSSIFICIIMIGFLQWIYKDSKIGTVLSF